MLYVPHALYILHEVWQESGKERTSKLSVDFAQGSDLIRARKTTQDYSKGF